MKNSHLLKDENNKDKDNDNNGDSADLNNCSICKNANDSYMVLIYMNSK